MITFINNHIEQALDRLLFQYKNKTRIRGLISSFVDQIQDIEDAAEPVLNERGVETSIGVQLDEVGKIVGVTREAGEDDATFRARVKVKIIQNLNEGTAEEVIAAAKFFLAAEAIWYLEVYPAEVDIMTSTEIAEADRARIRAQIESFLPSAVSLGNFGFFDEDNPFIFNGGNGFGDVNDSNVGGLLAELY